MCVYKYNIKYINTELKVESLKVSVQVFQTVREHMHLLIHEDTRLLL